MVAIPEKTSLGPGRAGPHAAAKDGRVALVFCYADRSGRSRRAEGFLAQVLQRRKNHNTFRLFRVDADTRADLLERFAVREIPSLVVVADGRIRGRLANPRGCAEITRFLSPWLK